MENAALPSPTRAFFNEGGGGYGHRLFLPSPIEYWESYDNGDKGILEKSRAAHEVLRELSCWHGADKKWSIDGIVHLGYEFPIREWNEVLAKVGAAGITFYTYESRPEMKIETIN